MNYLMLNLEGSNVRPLTIISKLVMALMTGYIICTGGEFQSFRELARLPGFMVAFFTSVGIAVFAIEQVYYSTRWLHRRLPTYDADHLKIRWQIIFCFVAPFITIFVLASGYYAYHGYFILDTMWPTSHAWQIFFMLLALNLLYAIPRSRTVSPAPELALSLVLPPVPLVTYVKNDKGVNTIHFNEGAEKCEIGLSLHSIFKTLDPNLYILNPKDSIIRCDNIIKAYDSGVGRLRIELISPAGTIALVARRQKKAYIGYF
jgi:hypothetical protein